MKRIFLLSAIMITLSAVAEVPAVYDPADYVYVNKINAQAPYRTVKGLVLTGDPGQVRVMEQYAWSTERVKRYADVANTYAREMPGVHVYVMPIPLASQFYMPDAGAPSRARSQHAGIHKMFSMLDKGVTGIDLVPTLGKHAAEHIYSRTDHHWAPLGAFYAARQLAAHAGVPFLPLTQYTRHEVPGYVGTMYQFSKDPSVKASPETFVYYTPDGIDYTTTYITYKMQGQKVVGEGAPAKGQFFIPARGAAAYCTFMGGDSKITRVDTGLPGGRRVLIVKDSFGNAVPGYLFGSFEQVHVIDSRYFTKNLKKYVADNKITDVVLANNISHASSNVIYNNLMRYLRQ